MFITACFSSATFRETTYCLNKFNLFYDFLRKSWWCTSFNINNNNAAIHGSSRPEVFCKEVFCKKGVLRNFVKFTRKHLCQSFFNKVTLAQVFSCEFCEISKNTFSRRTPPVAASVYILSDETCFPITVFILLLHYLSISFFFWTSSACMLFSFSFFTYQLDF